MKLLALILALLAHRMLPWRPGLQPAVAHVWRPFAGTALPAVILLLVAVALAVLVAGVQALLRWLLGDLAAGLFALVLLWLALGSVDLVADVRAAMAAHRDGDELARSEAMRRLDAEAPQDQGYERRLVEAVFSAAVHRWLAPGFWFVVLGAAGVVFYVMVQVALKRCRDGQLPSNWQALAQGLQRGLVWPVAVLATLGLAVMASADVTARAVLRYWREQRAEVWRLEAGFLYAALRDTFYLGSERSPVIDELGEQADVPPGCLRLSQGLNLLWRVLLFLLALLALATVLGWVA